jgi:hypothetical protein
MAANHGKSVAKGRVFSFFIGVQPFMVTVL